MTDEELLLWEIFVPTRNTWGNPITVKYHRIWDQKVRKIVGGLTLFHSMKGNWLSPEGESFVEHMIPVRIACTREEIRKIADVTAAHYRQQAVMYYLVSNEVAIKHYSVGMDTATAKAKEQ